METTPTPTPTVEPMFGRSGNPVANQYVIRDGCGSVWFQSYQTIIAHKARTADGYTITLDADYWDYSVTTSRYLNQWLERFGPTTSAREGVKTGLYKLAKLN